MIIKIAQSLFRPAIISYSLPLCSLLSCRYDYLFHSLYVCVCVFMCFCLFDELMPRLKRIRSKASTSPNGMLPSKKEAKHFSRFHGQLVSFSTWKISPTNIYQSNKDFEVRLDFITTQFTQWTNNWHYVIFRSLGKHASSITTMNRPHKQIRSITLTFSKQEYIQHETNQICYFKWLTYYTCSF